MANTFKFGNGKWYGKRGTIMAYNDENKNIKPLAFDFTRDSIATYVGSDGLIKTAGDGEPRVDYLDNTDGHLLLEPSRINLLQRSEEFGTTWSRVNLTITDNQIISPDGTQNADLLQETSATGSHDIRQNVSGLTTSAAYTYSIFVKEYSAGSTRRIGFYIGGINSSGTFDFSQEAFLSNHSFETAEAINYGNGWYRLIITDTTTGTTFNNIIILDNGSTSSYAGDGTSGVYLWGAQLEQGSYATSYIPTEGASVTRTAETCSGADVSNIISNQGTLYIEFDYLKETFPLQQYIFTLGTDASNVIWLRKESGSNTSTARIRTSSVNQYTKSIIDIPTGLNKFAVTFSTSGSKIYLNGTEIYSTTSSLTLPTLSTINFNLFSGTGSLDQETKDLRLYNTVLTDSELKTLTT